MSRRDRYRRRQRNRRHPVRRVALMSVLLAICGVIIAAMSVIGWIVSVADSAPNINELKARDPGQVSEVFGSDGHLLGYIATDVLRTVLPDQGLPKMLKNATVAIEDRRFYQHGGVDYQGILRAGVKDLVNGGTVQGGSTLTMQLVDNVYLPNDIRSHHNIKYKIIQAKLANELEAKRSKGWILDEYLNDVDYGTLGGQTAYGVGAAAQMFFDKPISKLNLAQYALLAGLPQAPSEDNPFNNPRAARSRRTEVLQSMVTAHYITQAQADAAAASPLQVKRNSTYQTHRQPFIFDYVKHALIQRYGLKTVQRGGLKVYTTIDTRRQAEATAALLAHEGGPGQPASALVSINPRNGNILAMATTSAYGTGPGQTTFDYAWQAHRQTGSAFKVFSLMTLIHDYDGDPNQTYYVSKELVPGWLPNYPTYGVKTSELTYQGNINITRATTESDNTVFAQLAQDLTLPKVTATAHAMGITSPLTDFPSEALGAVSVSPLEMADAYATLASGGIHHPPSAISKVVFPDGSTANLGSPAGNRVFSYGEVYAADQVLKTVITSGTGTAANYGCPAAGKTGTTSSFTDAYFDGYTSQLATAVWVGYPNATTTMPSGFGGTLAAPIWHDYMQQASDGYCTDFTAPTVPWQGTAFFGNFATTGNAKGNNGTGTNGSGGAGTGTSTNSYNNPSHYQTTPQPQTPTTPKTGNGNGNGNGKRNGTGNGGGNKPPAGFGGGHNSGGGGVKKP